MDKMKEKKALMIASFLLQYPDENWYELLEEAASGAEEISEEAYFEPILKFLEHAGKSRELDLAELYVNTFDFTKEANLHLSYYRFKEQRERGMELVRLKQRYGEAGFDLSKGELPDFLPLVLEFAAASGDKDILMDNVTAVREIFENLSVKNNPYSQVINAVLLLAESWKTREQADNGLNAVSCGGVSV